MLSLNFGFGRGGGCHLESFKFWGEKFVGTLKL